MQIRQNRDLIIGGNMYKALLKLSLPIILSNLIQTVYNLTDTYFVSRLGDSQVAAVGLVSPVMFCVLGLGFGIANGSKALISQYFGAEQNDDAKHAAGQTLTLAVILSVTLTAIGVLLAPWIVRAMGGTGEVYEDGLQYLRIVLSGAPFLFLFVSYQSIRQGEGSMMMPLIFSVLSVSLNIILDPIFIFVLNMGVAGAAIATTIARALFAIIAVATLFLSKKSHLKPKIHELKPDFKMMYKILQVGIPASLGQVISSFGFMMMNFLVISYGNDVMTAFTIGGRINNLVMMPCMGIGGAVTIIIGQNIGAGNLKRATEAFNKAVLVGMLISTAGILLMLPLRMPFIKMFTGSPQVMGYTKSYLDIILFAMPLMCFMEIVFGVFFGSGYSKYAMVIMMARLWVFRLPLIALLKYGFHMNEFAVWYPMIISNLISCLIGYMIYRKGKWKTGVIR